MQTDKASTFGRYEILSELGRGAMGIVYKAYDPKINRLVALKTILLAPPDSIPERTCRDHFFREAEAAGRLFHPRIVTIFDIGEDPDTSSAYIVMEYVAGRSLEETLSTEGASLPVSTTLQIVQEVAEALDYAHLQGVVHRDVKPSNIVIGEDGHARIADFGIAQVNVADSRQPGRVWGTPAYMSPEQFKGESVDGRSDLFSLGVILYRMLTGHRPFQGNSAQTVSLRVVNQDPVPATVFNTDLSPEFDRVIRRAIAKNPEERYQTGMEMVFDLQRLRDGIELQNRGKAVLSQEGSEQLQAANLGDLFFSPAAGSKGSRLGADSFPRRRLTRSDPTRAPARWRRPWQQLGVGFLTLGSWVLAFAGLWRAIPIQATPGAASMPPGAVSMPSNPPADRRIFLLPGIVSDALTAAGPPKPSVVRLPVKNHATEVQPNHISPSDSATPDPPIYPSDFPTLDESRSCRLGIAVEHHFVTANLSVWIDDEPAYNHSLLGAVKTRVVLFKGVEGYLSDVVQLTPGDHHIRVRISSADGSYDQSDSISGTFAPDNEQLLAIDFDKHNRHMRLTLEAKKHF